MEVKGICRICLCNVFEMHSVSLSYKITSDKTVSDVINAVSGVQISNQDFLPKYLCLNCYQTVLFIDNYCQLIVKSDIHLKQLALYQQNFILERTKIEPPDEEDPYVNVPDDLLEIQEHKLEINIKEEPNDYDEAQLDNVSQTQEEEEADETQSSNNNKTDIYGSKSCNICGKNIILPNMKKHLLTHNKPGRVHKCKRCPKIFKQSKSLIKHKKKCHVEDTSFRSTLCDKEFMTLPALKLHRQKNQAGLYCYWCKIRFNDKKEFDSHRLTVHKKVKNIGGDSSPKNYTDT